MAWGVSCVLAQPWLHSLSLVLLVLLAGLLSADAAVKRQPLLHEQWLDGWQDRWQHSQESMYDGVFTVSAMNGTSDKALLVPTASRRYGLSTILPQPLQPTEGLVLQYEVQFSEGHTCGGGYIKLLPADPEFQPAQLSPKTPYTIMFGPDRCGPHSRVHLIIQSRNPKTGKLHERHLEDPYAPKSDKLTHVYTLELSPNNKFRILIDGQDRNSGDLLDPEEFFPPFQPPLEVPDPNDQKPEDWVDDDIIDDPEAIKPADWDERQMIPDPRAQRPEGWLVDEPLRIQDPEAQQPEDWDDAEQGPWQPPYVKNPACAVGCGKWAAPMIKNPKYKGPFIKRKVPNPAYKGEWKPRNMPNPDYFKEDNALQRFGPIGAVAFDLWSTDTGYLFSNILLANDDVAAAEFRKGPFRKKHEYQMRLAMAEYNSKKYTHLPIMTRLLFMLVDQPWMAAVKPYLAPAMQVLWHEPNYAYLALVIPAMMMVCGMCVLSARRHVEDEDDQDEQEVLAQLQADEVLEHQKAMSKAAAAKLHAQGKAARKEEPPSIQGGDAGLSPGTGTERQSDSSEEEGAAARGQRGSLRRRRAKA